VRNSTFLPTCLLCGSNRCGARYSLTADEILRCWTVAGQVFDASVTKPLFDEGVICLFECSECGFQSFNPKLAGGAAFYEHLNKNLPGYYAPARPENERNARFAVRHGYRTILDVGCGSGFALDAAKRVGLQTFGVELSRGAAEVAASRGHQIFPLLLEDMDRTWEQKFDLISLNQVLEHVAEPVNLVKQCTRFLSPRGVIAIAVPSEQGVLRFCPWLETNWPPHHVSRWEMQNFCKLADLAGLRIVETGADPLLGSFLESILLGHRQRCHILGKPYCGLPPFLIKALAFAYRKTGMKFVVHRGLSIYCFLEKPQP
jgi:SAM-dependent methyltransferase